MVWVWNPVLCTLRKVLYLWTVSLVPSLEIVALSATFSWMNKCMCVYVHIYICICLYMYIHIHMYIYTCVCIFWWALKLRHKLFAARQPRYCEMTLLIIPLCSCILQWTRDEGLPLALLHYWKWLPVLRRGIPYMRCFLARWIQSKLRWWDYELRKYLSPRSSPEPHLNGECFEPVSSQEWKHNNNQV